VPLVIDILRHGAAEPSSPDGDTGRALSESGAEEARALGRRLAAGGWSPRAAFTSPLRRARETAVLVLAALDAPPPIETLHELAPEADPADLAAALAPRVSRGGHVLLVSHMPLVTRLCGWFCGRPETFATGDLARLECADGLARGRAVWRGFPGRADSG